MVSSLTDHSFGCDPVLVITVASALGRLQGYCELTASTNPRVRRRPEEFSNRITPLALELEAHLEKLCNAIGLPPMLCVFMVLGVCVGLLGIVRTVNDTSLTTAMVLGTR